MTSTLNQQLVLLGVGLIAVALSAPRPEISDRGAALLVALACTTVLWLAGNWQYR